MPVCLLGQRVEETTLEPLLGPSTYLHIVYLYEVYASPTNVKGCRAHAGCKGTDDAIHSKHKHHSTQQEARPR